MDTYTRRIPLGVCARLKESSSKTIKHGSDCRLNLASLRSTFLRGCYCCIYSASFESGSRMIPLWSIPMALATGNTLILKPSERDPGAAMMIAELCERAGQCSYVR